MLTTRDLICSSLFWLSLLSRLISISNLVSTPEGDWIIIHHGVLISQGWFYYNQIWVLNFKRAQPAESTESQLKAEQRKTKSYCFRSPSHIHTSPLQAYPVSINRSSFHHLHHHANRYIKERVARVTCKIKSRVEPEARAIRKCTCYTFRPSLGQWNCVNFLRSRIVCLLPHPRKRID